jgi:hypothetical protein
MDVIDVLIQHKHSANMPQKNTYIDTLGLGDSVINNPQDIAAFLACPGVRSILVWINRIPDDDK